MQRAFYLPALVHENLDIYATVELAAVRVTVLGDRMGCAIADRHEDTSHRYALYFTEIAGDDSGAFFAELLVCLFGQGVGSVTCDLDHVSIERLRNVGEIGEISFGGIIQDSGISGKEDVNLKLVLVVVQIRDTLVDHRDRSGVRNSKGASSLHLLASLICRVLSLPGGRLRPAGCGYALVCFGLSILGDCLVGQDPLLLCYFDGELVGSEGDPAGVQLPLRIT